MVTWLAKNFTRWSCWPAMDTLILGKITKSSPVKPTFCLCKNTVTFTNRKSHIDLFTFFPIWYFDHSETRFDQTRISLRFDQTKISLCPTTVRNHFELHGSRFLLQSALNLWEDWEHHPRQISSFFPGVLVLRCQRHICHTCQWKHAGPLQAGQGGLCCWE